MRITNLYSRQEFGYELALKAFLLQAIFLLLQYSEKNADFGVNTSSDKLKNVLDYIEVHYAESIQVAELAGLCYFSEYHFMRFFKNT